jgi:CRISPR-associated endonuclease/helicase Cas3
MTRGTTNIALDEDALRRLLRCWGKTGAQGDGPSVFHPAVYHMLDAANVADQLLSPAASPRWRRILAAAVDAPADHLATWLPFFVALHDIGKISVPFQSQNQAQKARLKAEGFDFHGWMPALSMRHSVVSHIFLESALRNLGLAEVPAFLHTAWCNMASGHHGKFASTACLREAESTLNALEPQGWAQMRLQAACLLSQTLLLEPPAVWPRPLDVSAAAMVLAGFTTLCDWLASDSQYFCPAAAVSWADYLDHSRNKALERTRDAGFHEGTASRAPAVFSLLFADIQSARPLQTAIDSIPDDLLERPTLTIMEAPTGEGKTEAALALAHRIAQKTGCDELY